MFIAAVMAKLEDDLGYPVCSRFDLIVGTSTGGIIALGLGCGYDARAILETYVSSQSRIFGTNTVWPKLKMWFGPKYSQAGLRETVQSLFGARLLGESTHRLVIPAYNLDENKVHIFKTPHHPRLRRDFRTPMWAVAMATSAAPTYFAPFTLPEEHIRLVDGGVWANNPCMVGVTEAVSVLGHRLEDVRLLSVGTTLSITPRKPSADKKGALRWLCEPSFKDIFLHGQSIAAFNEAVHLLGEDRAHRLNPVAPSELASLDHCNAERLIAKAAAFSREFCPTFEKVFGGHTPSPYKPMYG